MSSQEEIYQSLSLVSREFDIEGQLTQARPYGSGHINDTFLVNYLENGAENSYIFQRINHHVFPDPRSLMNNFSVITAHLARKLEDSGYRDIHRRVLQPITAHNGENYVYDESDYLWRATPYIKDTTSYELVENTAQAYEVGRVYGQYQKWLLDLPENSLTETIRDFHNARWRYDGLVNALERDEFNRAATVAPEIRFITAREHWVNHFTDLQQSGYLPVRTIHNDTKVNNLLVDLETQSCICVTDLDTTMPGLILNDFGDMVRTAANTAPEDEEDLQKVKIDIERFRALTKGYLSSAGSFITHNEKDNLVFAGKLITYELAIRFLTDYLEGDHYFKIEHPDQNLVRCRSQLALVNEIEEDEEQLEVIVETMSNSN